MKKVIILILLCNFYSLFSYDYIYFKTGHNNYHIPFLSDWDMNPYHPGLSIGYGHPFLLKERIELYGTVEGGYNYLSTFQDSLTVQGLLSMEVKIIEPLLFKFALGGGGVFILQKGVYNLNKGSYQLNLHPGLMVSCQTGLRFRVPKSDSFYIFTEYEFQTHLYDIKFAATNSFAPLSSLSIGVLWKLGRNEK